eukprot:COSAG01_NODE_529_length_15890_cov_548.099994_13_plen_235_part_00
MNRLNLNSVPCKFASPAGPNNATVHHAMAATTIAGQTTEALARAAARVVADAEDIDTLTLRKLRQGVERLLNVDLSSAKREVKPIISSAFEAAVAAQKRSAAATGLPPPPRDSVGAFTQPTSPLDAASTPAGDGAAEQQQQQKQQAEEEQVEEAEGSSVTAAARHYACVRKATIRRGAAVSSDKLGSLAVGEHVTVLETREVPLSPGEEGQPSITATRVRFERGWVSVQSSSGA